MEPRRICRLQRLQFGQVQYFVVWYRFAKRSLCPSIQIYKGQKHHLLLEQKTQYICQDPSQHPPFMSTSWSACPKSCVNSVFMTFDLLHTEMAINYTFRGNFCHRETDKSLQKIF